MFTNYEFALESTQNRQPSIRCALPDVRPFLVILLTRCLFAAEEVIVRQLKDTVAVFAPRVGAHRTKGYRIGVFALDIGFERVAAAHAAGHVRAGEYQEAFGSSQEVFR